MTQHAVAADMVFDGTAVRSDYAAVMEGTLIAAVVPVRELPAGISVRRLPAGTWLAPGFIDVQVNGGGDVLFNDQPTPAGIAAIVEAHRRFGTTSLLPTLITDTREKMRAARAAVDAVLGYEPGVLGIHFEGPFLSPERPGVHDPDLIRLPDADDVALLVTRSEGVTLVTLAPERMPPGFIAALVQAGIKVSLGHSAATYDETRAAIAEGVTGFTHLFNAMPPLLSRAPGPIAAALETQGAFYGLIVDGEHVSPPALRVALRGLGQPMLVTDAMPPVGGRLPGFSLYGNPIRADGVRLVREDGTLAGSSLDMASAVRNCVRLLGLTLEQALPLASAAPAGFLGLDNRLGQLKPGFRADLVAFDPASIQILDTWVAGQATDEPL
jgi:N-acetylglucosamine-6-phosphate deacetylase